jgi:ATP-dependent protease ClpP protease subunit
LKEELLRSVASPAQVFYAPFGLVLMNMAASIAAVFLLLALGLGGYIWAPIVSFMLVHPILILIGKREPHIDNILRARRNIRAKTKNIIREDGNKFAA